MFRAHHRLLPHIASIALSLLLADAGATFAYAPSDLLGVWRFHGLASGPGAPYWERATGHIAADGSFTGFTRSSTGGVDTVQGVYTLGPTGVVTIAGEPAMRGALDVGRTVMVSTDTWDSGSAGTTQMMLALRHLGAYAVSDLAGTWEIHSTASGPGAPWWLRGRVSVDASGAFSGSLAELGGAPEPASGTFALTSDGVLSLSVASAAEGSLDAGRTVFALTNTWTGFAAGTTELSLGVKLAASYAPADLAGTWEVHTLATGPGAPWWSRGSITIASNGSFSGTHTNSDGSSGPMSGTMTLGPDGTLTRVGSTTARGALDAGRSVMIWTDTWTTGSPGTSELLVGVRTGGATTGAPEVASAGLALEPAAPNPSRGGRAAVRFRLTGGTRAGLDLFDAHGRVVSSRDVSELGGGWHRLSLSDNQPLTPGLYWLRLREGGSVRTQRLVILD